MDAETLITDATIVDGTGNPEYRANIAISDGRITIVRGETAALRAQRTIDGGGLVAAPGFIDMHSHSALHLLFDGQHQPKTRQGVTTEVIGVDGISYAPIARKDDLEALVRMNSGLEGMPQINYDWTTVETYLNKFQVGTSVNIAMLVGNTSLRISACGWDDRPATARETDHMSGMLRESMEAGAFGLSSGLDYPPGSFATTSELVTLVREAARYGGFYHTHVRYQLGDRFLDPFREALAIGREAESPVHITHFYRRSTAPGGSYEMLDLIDQGTRDGLELTFDSYPYPFSSTRLLILIPDRLQAGGPDALLSNLRDHRRRPEIRRAIDDRAKAYGGNQVWATIHLGGFRAQENLPFEGKSIEEIVELRHDTHPADTLCELLVAEDLAVNEVAASGDPATIPTFLRHRLGMVGTDSIFIGDRPSPRTYGSYPYILGQVRAERWMPLTEAVRKMTSLPAQRLGLPFRGLLRDGFFADLVLFDRNTVSSNASHVTPKQYPQGIEYVFVNGEIVIDRASPTSALPGRVLRMHSA